MNVYNIIYIQHIIGTAGTRLRCLQTPYNVGNTITEMRRPS